LFLVLFFIPFLVWCCSLTLYLRLTFAWFHHSWCCSVSLLSAKWNLMIIFWIRFVFICNQLILLLLLNVVYYYAFKLFYSHIRHRACWFSSCLSDTLLGNIHLLRIMIFRLSCLIRNLLFWRDHELILEVV